MFCAQRQFERRIFRKTRRILRIVFLLFANHCLKLQNKKSIKGARIQISGSSNQNAPLRTNKSDHPIRLLWQDQQVGLSKQIASSGPTSRIVQSYRYGRTNKSDRPIRSFLRTYFPYRPIRSFERTYFPYRLIRSFLRTYFTYLPIRSFLRNYFPYRPIRTHR